MKDRLRSLWMLLTDPAGWSARRYRTQPMAFTAVRPHRWRRPGSRWRR